MSLLFNKEDMRFGIVDLGTNSIRLFIFECLKKRCELLVREKMMVRLGDGVYDSGKLNADAMQRTLKAFSHFHDLLDDYGVDKIRCVATSALRVASNSKKFKRKVYAKTGFEIEVISPEEEAELIALGVTSHVDLPDKKVVLIDMGGGSTEVSLCKGSKALISRSIPIGAARGQQLFLKTVPPAKGGEAALREHVDELLAEIFFDPPFKSARLAIGSSGSIRAFSRIYEFNTCHARVFTRRFLRDATIDLSQYTRKQLQTVPGLEARRIDLITSAGIILHQIMRYFDVHKLQVTKYALKDGILVRMLKES